MTTFAKIFVSATLLWSASAKAQQCDKELVDHYASLGWGVVKYENLNEDDKLLWTQNHDGFCPGIANIHWGASKKKYLAVALLHNESKGRVLEKLVLVSANDFREIAQLSSASLTSNPRVVWVAKPGKFIDRRTGRKIHIRENSIVYEEMESRAVQFYYERGKIHSLVAAN